MISDLERRDKQYWMDSAAQEPIELHYDWPSVWYGNIGFAELQK